MPAPPIEAVRSEFPALAGGFAFFENAGGSQVPRCVSQAVALFMEQDYAQTGAGYPASERADRTVAEAHAWADHLVGAEDSGVCALGASTSALLQNLAWAYSAVTGPGDEFVVAVSNHEANIGPWVRLERFGATVKWWNLDEDTGTVTLRGLEPLLGPRTKLVAMPHTSNLLGDVAPVRDCADAVHAVGARLVVDGVAFAPHGLVDVAALGADYYALSTYKVFGPHMAVLFGRHEAWAEIEGPNHFFVPQPELPRKFELGCLAFESLAGFVALQTYFQRLTGSDLTGRELVEAAYRRIAELEAPLVAHLDGYLRAKAGVRLVGPAEKTVPTWGFTSHRAKVEEIASHVNRQSIGIRHGHMYAYRLCEALGIAPEPGVARVSAVHYNTPEEANRLTAVLDEVL